MAKAGSASAANKSCISVSSLRGGGVVVVGFGGFRGIGGFGDATRMAFVGGHGMGDSSAKVVRFRFSICYWLGGAGAASGTFSGCEAVVVVGFLISVRISFTRHWREANWSFNALFSTWI
jgi:hypothetical protein